ncbi:hypothetical protein AJ78_06417 [Emergomyces pasteurianus Ep9510]|uniref:Uncharacterized protein n=1 Tax=Emergomyces pasteurianus Ep9510 TaxID=1447872 RepID=A0A1J9QA84_9EURO|nr:hypothetical protein AJ78_06417 [Emergomyces pasteurianus Ep9510]
MATEGNPPAPTTDNPAPPASGPSDPTVPTVPPQPSTSPTAVPPPQTTTPPPPPPPPPTTQPDPNPPPSSRSTSSTPRVDPPPPNTPQPPPPPPQSRTTPPGSNTTVYITSTASNPPPPATQSPDATTSGLPSVLPHPSTGNSGSGGLSAAGTIAVAVVVPVASVALIILVLLWWWRKRKARKIAEEERKQEIEEYRFNPNHDPLLPAVGLPGNFDDGAGMKDGNGGGYRGWGTTTSTSRKLSTNLSSGAGGITASDAGSNPGPPRPVSPVDDSIPYEDDNRPISGDYSGLDPAAAAMLSHPNGNNNTNARDIHRGPSNASSAYSNANRSDLSDDIPMPGVLPGTAQYYDDPYYTDGTPQTGGPFVDNAYGAPPVIRDVQARRNTRIENPSVFPQQGNAGIAQNF